ncbi:hypothetical protein NQD34_008846, partial [Periophthalmus magnuspinnatus]
TGDDGGGARFRLRLFGTIGEEERPARHPGLPRWSQPGRPATQAGRAVPPRWTGRSPIPSVRGGQRPSGKRPGQRRILVPRAPPRLDPPFLLGYPPPERSPILYLQNMAGIL